MPLNPGAPPYASHATTITGQRCGAVDRRDDDGVPETWWSSQVCLTITSTPITPANASSSNCSSAPADKPVEQPLPAGRSTASSPSIRVIAAAAAAISTMRDSTSTTRCTSASNCRRSSDQIHADARNLGGVVARAAASCSA